MSKTCSTLHLVCWVLPLKRRGDMRNTKYVQVAEQQQLGAGTAVCTAGCMTCLMCHTISCRERGWVMQEREAAAATAAEVGTGPAPAWVAPNANLLLGGSKQRAGPPQGCSLWCA